MIISSLRKLKSLRRSFVIQFRKRVYRHLNASERGLCFPDFLGIGAPRSGTTWLYENLKCHPELFIPEKELHFFDREFHRSLRHYSNKFKLGDHRLKGEITPAYAHLPVEIIQIIKMIMPEVKLIYLLRNPVERAWSSVRKNLFLEANRKIEDVEESEIYDLLESEGSKMRSSYLDNLNNWLSVFPRDQLFIGFFDHIISSPKELLIEIFNHIGVSSSIDWSSYPLHRVINRAQSIPMPEKYKEFLSNMYRNDIESLYKTFGAPIDKW